MKLVDILISIKQKEFSQLYTYQISDELFTKISRYSIVVVPFGQQIVQGIVLNLKTENKFEENASFKSVITVAERHVLNPIQLEFLNFLKQNQICSIQSLMKAFIPKANKIKLKVYVPFGDKEYLYDRLSYPKKKEVNSLLANDKLKLRIELEYKVKAQYEKIVKFEKDEIGLTKRQSEVLMLIKKRKVIKLSELIHVAKCTRSVIDKLEAAQTITITDEQKIFKQNFKSFNKIVELTAEQIQATEQTKVSTKPVLIHGVTGSGKSEVYLKLVENLFMNAKQESDTQVLILVPTATIMLQFIQRLNYQYKDQVIFLDEKMAPTEYLSYYEQIKEGTIKVVIGTFKTIFAPFKNLQLVIVDEEHDQSYQLRQNINLKLRTYIEFLEQQQIKVVLGSATPSLETYARAQVGKYKLVSLKNTFKNGDVKIAFAEQRQKNSNNELINPNVIKEIKQNEQQTLILYNTLGYAPSLICDYCLHEVVCPLCKYPLTYFQSTEQNRCRRCMHTEKYQAKCNMCNHGQNIGKKIGIEQVEEFLKAQNLLIGRLDTSQKHTEQIAVINKFFKQEIKVLIGTQILSLGIDFKNIGLIVILNIDYMLKFSDFRANERVYQILEQMIGRAARDGSTTKVLIDTIERKHFVFQNYQQHNYRDFFQTEMANRKLAQVSPFMNQIDIYISHENADYIDYLFKLFEKKISGHLCQVSRSMVTDQFFSLGMYTKVISVKYKLQPVKNDIRAFFEYLKQLQIDVQVDFKS
ncbi:MAG: replication restart helicase PriA [Mycoplasmatales bacterium]